MGQVVGRYNYSHTKHFALFYLWNRLVHITVSLRPPPAHSVLAGPLPSPAVEGNGEGEEEVTVKEMTAILAPLA